MNFCPSSAGSHLAREAKNHFACLYCEAEFAKIKIAMGNLFSLSRHLAPSPSGTQQILGEAVKACGS